MPWTQRKSVDRLLNEVRFPQTYDQNGQNGRTAGTKVRLPVNVAETADAFIVEAAVPGLDVDEIQLEFHDGSLHISGELPQTTRESATYHLRERWYGRFERSLSFTSKIEFDAIDATLENGVLRIQLPKHADVRARRIPVTTLS